VTRWRAGSIVSRPRSSFPQAPADRPRRSAGRFGAAQDRADAGDQQPLAEGLGDIIVGAHRQAQRLVELVVLAGQEDHRDRALLAQPPEQLEPVHLGHLDVEHRQIGRILDQRLERAFAVRIDAGEEPLGLERDRDRGEDVAVVIDQRDRRGHAAVRGLRQASRQGLKQSSRAAQSTDNVYWIDPFFGPMPMRPIDNAVPQLGKGIGDFGG
jgi:hypothetical protein